MPQPVVKPKLVDFLVLERAHWISEQRSWWPILWRCGQSRRGGGRGHLFWQIVSFCCLSNFNDTLHDLFFKYDFRYYYRQLYLHRLFNLLVKLSVKLLKNLVGEAISLNYKVWLRLSHWNLLTRDRYSSSYSFIVGISLLVWYLSSLFKEMN